MSRYSGKDGAVSVDGVGITQFIGWDMSTTVSNYLQHQGASMVKPVVYPIDTQRTGSFRVEANDEDVVQTTLMAGNQNATLILQEKSGVAYTFEALITPSVAVDKNGAVVRSFQFIEVATA